MITIHSSDVLERFALLSGAPDAAGYLPLCEEAAAETERAQRPGCGSEAAAPLAAAAAALAFYRYKLAQAGSCAGSFAAGDVKVEPSGAGVGYAKQLRRETLAAAAPYLTDNRFLFGRVNP